MFKDVPRVSKCVYNIIYISAKYNYYKVTFTGSSTSETHEKSSCTNDCTLTV
jgi:hypothetical protein